MAKNYQITEKRLRKIISTAIHTTLSESLSDFIIKEYRKGTDDWNYIAENKKGIYQFLNDGYRFANLGDFCGCDNERSLVRNATLIRIAFHGDQWVAIAVYTSYQGGFKNVGITAATDESLRRIGVAAVNQIIKKDIKFTKEFYWGEFSHAIAHYAEKYHGIKIPVEYVPYILGDKKPITPIDDFYYERDINGEFQKKVIYGFNSYETYLKVAETHYDYLEKCFDEIDKMSLDEDTNGMKNNLKLDKEHHLLAIVNVFVTLNMEGGCTEFPEDKILLLRNVVNEIQRMLNMQEISPSMIETMQLAVENGQYMLKVAAPMKCYKF